MAALQQDKALAWVMIIVIVAVIGYGVLNMPDRRTGAQRVGDAIGELPEGVDKAARQLEKRTPGEKLGDAVKDVGDEMKRQKD